MDNASTDSIITPNDTYITTIQKVSDQLDYAQFMEIICDSQEINLLKEKELSLSWGNKHIKEFLQMKSNFIAWFHSTTDDHRVKFMAYVDSQQPQLIH